MANTKSARKRIETNERNRVTNRYYKTSVRTLTKMFLSSLEIYKTDKTTENKEKAQKILNSIYSLIDKGTKRNVFHKNTAARRKSKLTMQFKAV